MARLQATSQLRPRWLSPILFGWIALPGCLPPDSTPAGDPDDEPAGRTEFAWRELETPDVVPRWGSTSVDRADATLVLGGVSGAADAVLDETWVMTTEDNAVQAAPELAMDRARYCHCAMLDEARNELIVLGGRGGDFGDATTAAVIDLANATTEVVEDSGAADHPVGCQTFFFPALDRGYVFGGLSSTNGTFSGETFRYDAATHTFTALDIPGPPARYDAATHVLDDGTGLLVSGMGRPSLAVTFFQDLWRFDPTAETWTEIAVEGDRPPGRRYPWSAVSPDESVLLVGYGSDSGMGNTVLGDLWSFSFADGTWAELSLPDAPTARGFTFRWQGGPASAGTLGFGFDGQRALGDAWTLLVPDALAGRWH